MKPPARHVDVGREATGLALVQVDWELLLAHERHTDCETNLMCPDPTFSQLEGRLGEMFSLDGWFRSSLYPPGAPTDICGEWGLQLQPGKP